MPKTNFQVGFILPTHLVGRTLEFTQSISAQSDADLQVDILSRQIFGRLKHTESTVALSNSAPSLLGPPKPGAPNTVQYTSLTAFDPSILKLLDAPSSLPPPVLAGTFRPILRLLQAFILLVPYLIPSRLSQSRALSAKHTILKVGWNLRYLHDRDCLLQEPLCHAVATRTILYSACRASPLAAFIPF